MRANFRALPSVDRLLGRPAIQMLRGLPAELRTDLARSTIERARDAIRSGRPCPTIAALEQDLLAAATRLQQAAPHPLINATGVIIHTNLGRAPLSAEARAAMDAVTRDYSDLEFDLSAGERGSRHTHLGELLRRVTGAEDGIAVNNNAGALLLVLASLASGREAVISRSQAVEIGGGFRIPDVMRQSGARLVEVGTTNRTYLRDFAEACSDQTAAFLRVHSSNFRISGFTTFPDIETLAELAHEQSALMLDDLGSGCLLPVERFGLAPEPRVQASIAAGVDVALFSGDKLLGGPQAGIIVGRAPLIQQIRSHPLARALRIDKASIAALNATLHHYLHGEALEKIPVWRMIATPEAELQRRAWALATSLGANASTRSGRSMVGGGSLPEESLPTCLLVLDAPSPASLAARLRAGVPPVVARIEHDLVLLDLRTVDPQRDGELLGAVRHALAAAGP